LGKIKISTDDNQKMLDDYKSFVIKYLHACLYCSTRVYVIENSLLGLFCKRG
jgi:hypothetical protein